MEADLSDLLFGDLVEVQGLVVELHGSLVGGFQEIDAPEQGGLSAAGRTDDADHVPFVYFQADPFQHLVVPECFMDMINFQHDMISSVYCICSSFRSPMSWILDNTVQNSR